MGGKGRGMGGGEGWEEERVGEGVIGDVSNNSLFKRTSNIGTNLLMHPYIYH